MEIRELVFFGELSRGLVGLDTLEGELRDLIAVLMSLLGELPILAFAGDFDLVGVLSSVSLAILGRLKGLTCTGELSLLEPDPSQITSLHELELLLLELLRGTNSRMFFRGEEWGEVSETCEVYLAGEKFDLAGERCLTSLAGEILWRWLLILGAFCMAR